MTRLKSPHEWAEKMWDDCTQDLGNGMHVTTTPSESAFVDIIADVQRQAVEACIDKIPAARLSEDALHWECPACGARGDEDCGPDCMLDNLETSMRALLNEDRGEGGS